MTHHPTALALLLALAPAGRADDARRDAARVVGTYCHACHGPAKQAGKLRLDRLDYDLVAGPDADHWQEVLDRFNKGEMPPAGAPQPSADERQALSRWLSAQLDLAAAARRKLGSGAVLRRMNRTEYSNTLRDLLAVPVDFAGAFPPEGPSADGFTNNGQTLGMSPLQVEYYLKTARLALGKAVATGPAPERFHYRLTFRTQKALAVSAEVVEVPKALAAAIAKNPGVELETFRGKNQMPQAEGTRFVALSPAVPAPGGADLPSRKGPLPCLIVRFRDFALEGEVRVRVRASSVPDADGRHAYLNVYLGNRLDDGIEFKPVGQPVEVRATADRPEVYEFRGRLENFPLPFARRESHGEYGQFLLGVWNAYRPAGPPGGPVLRVDSVEVEGPCSDAWPPAAHRRLFLDSPNRADEAAYLREVLAAFLTRAYRRPAAAEEVERVVKLWKQLRPDAGSFEESVRDVLPAVLASPRFLYLVEPHPAGPPRPLTGYELASRLSYFLTGSMPDDELFRLAKSGELTRPKVLGAQVERLIDGPGVEQFVEAFTREWLDLDALRRVTVAVPGTAAYYSKDLEQALAEEPRQFFREVLRHNLSSLNFLASDFAMLNPSLAAHYGVKGVEGPYFRRVALRPEDHRGGLLTQAAVLTGQSTGKESHPIKRAVWLKKRLLDDPPPPPPPNVPELDDQAPQVRGLSLRKRLEAHRDHAACAACHRAIDPWGLPFEQYDALGRWRTPGPRVEASATLPDGTDVSGVAGLQAYLVKHQSQAFARALVRKVTTYALGRSLGLGDGPAIERLAQDFIADGYRLRPLLAAVVASDLFTTR